MTDHDLPQPPTAAPDGPSASQMLRRGACQLAALRAASAGLIFGPTLDDRVAMLERARMELLQLDRSDATYADVTGNSLLEHAESELEQLPAPRCWQDATLARLLVCLSSRIELEDAHEAGRPDTSALVHEIEHVNAAHAALRELGDAANAKLDLSSPFATKWLDVALQALPGEAARARYLTALEREFGLRLPN